MYVIMTPFERPARLFRHNAMDMKRFSAFKYHHNRPAVVSPARWRFTWVSAALALLVAGFFFPAGALAFLIPLIAYFSAPRILYVGPRYLLCGDIIIYFGNVVRLDLKEADGTLTLVTCSKKTFILERENFPTNARKSHKIAANKAAKFTKASARLIERVRRAAPEAELHGIPAIISTALPEN